MLVGRSVTEWGEVERVEVEKREECGRTTTALEKKGLKRSTG